MENNAEGSRLDAKSDEELLREVRIDQAHRRAIDLRTSIRASTPEMHDNLGTGQDVILGPFDVDPGESKNYHGHPQCNLVEITIAAPEFRSWTPTPEALSFLLDSDLWKSIGSRQIHVRFKATFDEGRRINRTGITCPSASTDSRGLTSTGEVAIEMTDNKSRRTTDIIDVKHLLPAPPTKKDTDCIILEGEHRCELVKVLKINKKIGTATLVSWHSNSEKWDESLEHLCWVEMYK